MKGYLYIITNNSNKVLYIGVTRNINKRINVHKKSIIPGFTTKYKVAKLVYLEEHENIFEAIKREKQLKNWHRDWKVNLIMEQNPGFEEILLDPETSSG